MIDSTVAILMTAVVAAAFAAAGVAYVRRGSLSIEDYLVARGSTGSTVATATLVASVIGAWVLLSPAEAGTWAGLVALIGYGIGQAAPLVAFVFVGPRMRRLMPQGHSLTEYVKHRYGSAMHLFTLGVIVFYMFVFLSAELTGIAKAFELLSGTDLWITALIIGLLTAGYTAYGGLRASIFTDTVQFVMILPLLLIAFLAAVSYLDGFGDALAPIREDSAHLLSLTHRPGVEFGIALIIAILAANMFHQGFWQRVYSSRDDISLQRGFAISGAIVVPVIILMGMLGIMAVGRGILPSDFPVALFWLVQQIAPTWVLVAVLLLALMLVMSSLDTLLNGIASAVVTDLAGFRPGVTAGGLLKSSRGITVALILPAIFIASQGYSVLYLFLIADLVCAAAVFPVFWGLYSKRFTGGAAVASSVAGLVAGMLFFPTTAVGYATGWIVDIGWATQLLVSFGSAMGVSVVIGLALTALARTSSSFDFDRLKDEVRLIPE